VQRKCATPRTTWLVCALSWWLWMRSITSSEAADKKQRQQLTSW
jgi:hypothetical protein